MIKVHVKKLPHFKDLSLPNYATKQSAGMDLVAAISEDIILAPGERKLIPTGIAIALPDFYEAQIRPRSGLALKNGITVLNTPGTIDSDYRGEICVILVNLSSESFTVTRSMRIAQMVIARFEQASLEEVDDLSDTDRGSCGFGSTGIK